MARLKEDSQEGRQEGGAAGEDTPINPNLPDALGSAYALPTELLVVLCHLGNKGVWTKRRALEELKTYVEAELSGQDDYAVRQMFHAWVRLMFLMLLRDPGAVVDLLVAIFHAFAEAEIGGCGRVGVLSEAGHFIHVPRIFDDAKYRSPERMLACFTQEPGFEVNLPRHIFPARAELDNMLATLLTNPIDSSRGALGQLLAY